LDHADDLETGGSRQETPLHALLVVLEFINRPAAVLGRPASAALVTVPLRSHGRELHDEWSKTTTLHEQSTTLFDNYYATRRDTKIFAVELQLRPVGILMLSGF
jgi:hypothetical protein